MFSCMVILKISNKTCNSAKKCGKIRLGNTIFSCSYAPFLQLHFAWFHASHTVMNYILFVQNPFYSFYRKFCFMFNPNTYVSSTIELLNNNSHRLSPPGGLVSPSGGFLSLLCDQGLHFASIKLCLALSHQGAIIKIPVVRCHFLL